MSYVFAPKGIYVTVCAVPFLVLAYFVGEPGWVTGVDLAYLEIRIDEGEQKRNFLFLIEASAWLFVLVTHIMLASIDSGERPLRVNRFSMPRDLKWLILDVSVFICVISYHVYILITTDEQIFSRAMLAIFSFIMFRQILLNLMFISIQILPNLILPLSKEAVPENFFNLGRRTRRRTALTVTFLFLVAASLVVWSPSLLPTGFSPQYLAIVIATIVALPSVVISFYVQLKLISISDIFLDPLEKEISRVTENPTASKDEIDRIASLVDVRSELTKVGHLPWIAVAVSFLQVLVALATLLSVFD